MDDPIYTEEKEGIVIKIFNDDDSQSPSADGDTGLFLVGYHRSFWVDAPKDSKGYRLFEKNELAAHLQSNKTYKSLFSPYHIFGLEAYIHSGVSLALSFEGNFPDRQWDVSQLGAVFVSKKEWPDKKRAREAALSLISQWNDHLSGNVYGYKIETIDGQELDCCWGFVGDYEKYCLPEARNSAAPLITDNKKQIPAFLN